MSDASLFCKASEWSKQLCIDNLRLRVLESRLKRATFPRHSSCETRRDEQ